MDDTIHILIIDDAPKAIGRSDFLFLKKPFDPEEMRQLARAAATQWRIEMENRAALEQVAVANERLSEKVRALETAKKEIEAMHGEARAAEKATADLNRQLESAVALTAHDASGSRDRFLADDMNDYIPKPVRKRDLAQAIGTHLPGSRSPA